MRKCFPAAILLAFAMGVPARASAQEPAQAAMATAEAAVGTAVVDRELQGAADVFRSDVGTLYCHSRVMNAANSEVEHVWYHNDEEVARVKLNVGGSPWRTHSSKRVPEDGTGNWRCDVKLGDTVLKSVAFRVE